MDLKQTVLRDQENAEKAKREADDRLRTTPRLTESVDFVSGPNRFQAQFAQFRQGNEQSLRMIQEHPFHAMVEVEAQTERGTKRHLWYAHEKTAVNMPIGSPAIMIWSHPGVQLALSEELGEECDISTGQYTLRSVTPLTRAKFKRILPSIHGIYEPGGRVGESEKEERKVGLKAVKFDMTRDQVHAFISQMRGVMIVTGAPGSGKTTVAFQRIRFLLDQQAERVEEERSKVSFSEATTKIFLANPNLIHFSRNLFPRASS